MKTTKKLLSSFLSLVLVISSFGIVSVNAATSTTKATTKPTTTGNNQITTTKATTTTLPKAPNQNGEWGVSIKN